MTVEQTCLISFLYSHVSHIVLIESSIPSESCVGVCCRVTVSPVGPFMDRHTAVWNNHSDHTRPLPIQGINCVLLLINLSSPPDLSTSGAPEQLPLWSRKNRTKQKNKHIGSGCETYAKAPHPLPFINYVCIIFFLLCVLEEKLKRAIVFYPPGMKAFTTLLHRAWPCCRLGSEWNHNWRMHSALSPDVAGGPEYCTKINFVPSDGIFNLGEKKM